MRQDKRADPRKGGSYKKNRAEARRRFRGEAKEKALGKQATKEYVRQRMKATDGLRWGN